MLYLPRLFVYHAARRAGLAAVRDLQGDGAPAAHYITTPAMIASWVFGLILAFSGLIDWSRDGWFHAKLILVLALSAYHGLLVVWTKDFALDRNTRSPRLSHRQRDPHDPDDLHRDSGGCSALLGPPESYFARLRGLL